MKSIKLKVLNICSNGSSFFSYNTILKNSTQILFYKKDYLQIFFKKQQITTKKNTFNTYKNKYI